MISECDAPRSAIHISLGHRNNSFCVEFIKILIFVIGFDPVGQQSETNTCRFIGTKPFFHFQSPFFIFPMYASSSVFCFFNMFCHTGFTELYESLRNWDRNHRKQQEFLSLREENSVLMIFNQNNEWETLCNNEILICLMIFF